MSSGDFSGRFGLQGEAGVWPLSRYGLPAEYPIIRRARDYRLYDDKGRRYLDLYLDGGRAIMGHRPGHAAGALKNSLDRGLSAAYPAVEFSRLERALQELVPGYGVCRWYAGFERAVSAVMDWSGTEQSGEVPRLWDPASSPESAWDDRRSGGGQVSLSPRLASLWRPFLGAGTQAASEPPGALFPVLPLPGSGWLQPVLFCGPKAPEDTMQSGPPPSDPIPPFYAAAMSRAAYDLKTFLSDSEYTESYWSLFDHECWERRGPYLRINAALLARSGESGYAELVRKMLQRGVLLPPDPRIPAVIPARTSAGERKLLVSG
ncbi:MAG: hypothetical protein K9L68_06340 [Spirochaetales bacterium]|nr:hypothetical protein [Spirochaetales bacterium]MCF7938201.1 hypothetical protein [Spirochaetales bacterium]